jgi:CheY-like chemotaxis protein/two-component sensor histidine kinase
MEAVGQLTGGIAHDFNNLLTAIGGNLELLGRKLAAAEPNLVRYVEAAREAVRRAAGLTQRLLAFSRRQALQPAEVDPNKLVSGMSDLLHRTLGEHIDIEVVQATGAWKIFADANQLESALLNLAINSRDAMPDGGRLTIETANVQIDEGYVAREGLSDVKPGHFVLIAVSDTGKGMPSDVAQRAFEPFFTTKPLGEGTGLGLSMVYGFVKQSGGHAKIYSEEGHGTTIRLYLPRATAAAPVAERPSTAMAESPTGHGETILVVEDDPAVLAFEVEALTSAGYRVLEARNGREAIDLLSANAGIALLFTDVVLAEGMNGREVADRALAINPKIKVLYATGYTKNAIVHHGRLDQGVDLLSKPFTTNDLLRRVRRILAQAATTSPQ